MAARGTAGTSPPPCPPPPAPPRATASACRGAAHGVLNSRSAGRAGTQRAAPQAGRQGGGGGGPGDGAGGLQGVQGVAVLERQHAWAVRRLLGLGLELRTTPRHTQQAVSNRRSQAAGAEAAGAGAGLSRGAAAAVAHYVELHALLQPVLVGQAEAGLGGRGGRRSRDLRAFDDVVEKVLGRQRDLVPLLALVQPRVLGQLLCGPGRSAAAEGLRSGRLRRAGGRAGGGSLAPSLEVWVTGA